MTLERVPIPLPLLGLSEAVAADQQEPGTTQRALNVRGIDPRLPGRARLAQRSGLLPHGAGAEVVAGGSPITAMFRAVKDTPPDRWLELTTTAATDTTPAQVSTAWTTELASKPLAATVDTLGNCYTLTEGGVVFIHSRTGKELGRVTVPVPQAFELLPCIALDVEGWLYTASRYIYRVAGEDGLLGAGRLHRVVKVDDVWTDKGTVTLEWTPLQFTHDTGELLFTMRRPEDWDIDPERDGPAPAERVVRYGLVQTTPIEIWGSPAAEPTSAIAVSRDGDSVYVASLPNPSRGQVSSTPDTPEVQWEPREAVVATEGADAASALYMHLSAIRERTVRGLADGSKPATWDDARFDEADVVATVVDTTDRPVTALPDDGRGPTFDTNGMEGLPGFVFSGAQAMTTETGSGWNEKDTVSDQAPWAKSVFPNMRESGEGAKFVVHILFRIDATTDITSGGVAVKHYVFEQGDYSLCYEDDDPSNPGGDTKFTFTYPGGSSTKTTSSAGLVARHLLFTFVHAGHGVASSAWYLTDATTLHSATGLTVSTPQETKRTVLGGHEDMVLTFRNRLSIAGAGDFRVGDVVFHVGKTWQCTVAHFGFVGSTYEPGVGADYATRWTEVAKAGLYGAIGEVVVFLGGTSSTPHDTAPTTMMRQKLEGFTAWAYGRQGILDGTSPYTGAAPTGSGAPPTYTGTEHLASPLGLTVKYDRTNGRVVWAATNTGGACVVPSKDKYLLVGINTPRGAFRLIKDEGETVRTLGGAVDVYGFAADLPNDPWPQVPIQASIDHMGDMYIPWVDTNVTTARSVRRYAFEGNGGGGALNLWAYELGGGAYPVAALPAGLAVDETSLAGAAGPEFLYVLAVDESPTTGEPAYSVRRVDVLGRQATGSLAPREVALLAVTRDGTVSRYSSGAWSSVASTVLPSRTFVWEATLFQKSFLGNGRDYRVYDHRLQTLRAFEGSTRGDVPPRCRLGVAWRGRLVLARGDDAHNWYMSAVADPFDWDFAPVIESATAAVAGNNSEAGEVPDLVNALIPWSDDLLLFGGDSSIWRMTGDPMVSGELHRVSDTTGVAFGLAWCKDPEQRVYFWGSRGGMYVATPDGGVQPLSEGRIHRRLQDIDLGRNQVRLVWNDVDQGVHAFIVPLDGAGEPYHYFWERKTGGWWSDQFAGPKLQVRATYLLDGDAPQDRRLLLGCADGRIRVWSETAMDDDGEAIRSTCLVGPIAPDTAGTEYRMVAVEPVLARDGGGCRVAVGATPEADLPYAMGSFADLVAGRNGQVRLRARGANLWVEFQGTEYAQPWAVEDLSVYLARTGRKRMR